MNNKPFLNVYQKKRNTINYINPLLAQKYSYGNKKDASVQ